MSTTPFYLGDLEDDSWSNDPPDATQPGGLQFAPSENDWIVKLQFYKDGKQASGTGFYCNIPDASHDIILTAGHNLIDSTGKLTSDLKILPGDIPVKDDDVRVSAAYKANQEPEVDYGAILLPRRARGGGFGYSIKLAYQEYLKDDVEVKGYAGNTPPGQPLKSSGRCSGYYTADKEQLVYLADTQQGFSGCPVLFDYHGRQIVAAIHNHSSATTGKGNRGSRLTEKLLREVFSWVGAGEYGVRLRVRDPIPGTKLPPKGLYLNFSFLPFARVRLGSGTVFDVLPVQVTSGEPLYALTVDKKWVLFNSATQEVRLSETMKDGCLFKKAKKNEKSKTLKIVVQDKYQLRMQGLKIHESDGDDAESSEVSIVSYPGQDKALYTKFWFE